MQRDCLLLRTPHNRRNSALSHEDDFMHNATLSGRCTWSLGIASKLKQPPITNECEHWSPWSPHILKCLPGKRGRKKILHPLYMMSQMFCHLNFFQINSTSVIVHHLQVWPLEVRIPLGSLTHPPLFLSHGTRLLRTNSPRLSTMVCTMTGWPWRTQSTARPAATA